MKYTLKKLLHSEHPQHETLAFAMLGIGLILICNDYYFFWPPFAAKALNDDLVGGVFVVMGILLFIWARSTSSQVYANRRLLVLTAGLLASEATAELCHGFVSGHPHMIMAGFMELVVLRSVFIIISNSRKHNN